MARIGSRVSAFVCLNLLATSAIAQETRTYAYDALGRLVSTSVAGGPTGGLQTTTSFDPADNRVNYTVTGAPLAVFAVSDATIGEGGTVVVTIIRTGSVAGQVSVNYATANGSAASPSDYTAASGTLTFAPGESSKTVAVATIDDTAYEGSETFSVVLSSPSPGASIADGTGVVTITDNEVVPQLAISNASVTEGGTAILTVTRTGATGSPIDVAYATGNGSAGAPGDYTAASGTISFAPGETSRSVSVGTVDDSVFELAETFTVTLSSATGGAVISSAIGTVTVADNDSAPSFSIENASATEGGTIVMTISKAGATAQSHSVTYATANGTASAPGDYGAVSGTLTFLPGETTKSVTIGTVDDSIFEGSQTFSVQLSGATGGANVSVPSATATIVDNDAAPTLSISNASVVEGGTASVTVTKSGATELYTTVNYATTGIYQGVSGALTFLPGEVSKSIQVPIGQNGTFSGPRYFNVVLSSPGNATLTNNSGTVTIIEDDPAPTFTLVAAQPQFEGTSLQFSVVLSGNFYYDVPLTVNYVASSGSATAGTDFVPVSGTLTFTAPMTAASVVVPVNQDSDVEPDETVTVTISSPNYGSIDVAQASGTIKNDDIAPPAPSAPVANTDNAGNFARCDTFTISPLANDTDPGGNYPLSLVSVAAGTGYDVTISGNNVTFFAKAGGTRSVQYVVRNALGLQTTGIINFTVATGRVCM